MQMNSPDESVSLQTHTSTSVSSGRAKPLLIFSIYFQSIIRSRLEILKCIHVCFECGSEQKALVKHRISCQINGSPVKNRFNKSKRSFWCVVLFAVLDCGAIHSQFILDIAFVIFLVNGYREWMTSFICWVWKWRDHWADRIHKNEQRKKHTIKETKRVMKVCLISNSPSERESSFPAAAHWCGWLQVCTCSVGEKDRWISCAQFIIRFTVLKLLLFSISRFMKTKTEKKWTRLPSVNNRYVSVECCCYCTHEPNKQRLIETKWIFSTFLI